MSRIAVLGAGTAGVCTALELAQQGLTVDLYDRDPQPVSRASRVNEGKIHQGFIYAKDDTAHTASLMALGALTFRECLRRWIDADAAIAKSTPFIYALHKQTMLPRQKVIDHFTACSHIFDVVKSATGLSYLGDQAPCGFEELNAASIGESLNASSFETAFQTTELAVDPHLVAESLRSAVTAEPRIHYFGETFVENVARRGDGKYEVFAENSGREIKQGPYDQIVNALWDGRLKVDHSVGLTPPHSWSHRHKFGNRILIPLSHKDLPSVTVILGPFGDIVNFGDRGFFLSWYPVGMVSMTRALAPPRDWTEFSREERMKVFESSLSRWKTLCPLLDCLDYSEDAIDPASGVIFAWGDTDIDDSESRLHSRFEIGVHSVGGYHSVNTGKYTIAPFMAIQTAQRVLDGAQKPRSALSDGLAAAFRVFDQLHTQNFETKLTVGAG